MKIGFGCDHTAVELKLALMDHLREQGHECVDYGTKEAGVRMDYPVVGKRVAEAVAGGEVEKGVLVCEQVWVFPFPPIRFPVFGRLSAASLIRPA